MSITKMFLSSLIMEVRSQYREPCKSTALSSVKITINKTKKYWLAQLSTNMWVQRYSSLFLVLLVASLTDTIAIYHCVTNVEVLIYT